jgi:hypothetical protein
MILDLKALFFLKSIWKISSYEHSFVFWVVVASDVMTIVAWVPRYRYQVPVIAVFVVSIAGVLSASLTREQPTYTAIQQWNLQLCACRVSLWIGSLVSTRCRSCPQGGNFFLVASFVFKPFRVRIFRKNFMVWVCLRTNFDLEYAIRRVLVNQDGFKLNGTHQFLVSADVNTCIWEEAYVL